MNNHNNTPIEGQEIYVPRMNLHRYHMGKTDKNLITAGRAKVKKIVWVEGALFILCEGIPYFYSWKSELESSQEELEKNPG